MRYKSIQQLPDAKYPPSAQNSPSHLSYKLSPAASQSQIFWIRIVQIHRGVRDQAIPEGGRWKPKVRSNPTPKEATIAVFVSDY